MKTIVVRNAGRAIALENAAGGVLASVERDEGLATSVAEKTKVTVEDLSEGDLAELEASSEFLTATPMPLRLIEPVELDGEPQPGALGAHDAFVDNDGQGGKAAWGIVATGAASSQFSGRDVAVAVLDTGIDRNHPAFAGVNLVTRNFTDEADEDLDGHGTHCAGTIFGRDVGGIRIGVAPGVTQAFIGKVIPAGSEALVEAMQWAFAQGARITSMSLGYDFPGWVEQLRTAGIPGPAATSRALSDFRANIATFDALMGLLRAQAMNGGGMLVVAASGNESERALQAPQRPYTISASPPSAATGVIAVGALGRATGGLKIAPFSNTVPQIAAPGVGVLSARKGTQDLVAMNGTSMACPHAAGLAALLWDQALRGAGGPPRADRIANRLIGRADRDRLAPGFKEIDVGAGLAVAPS